MGWLPIVICLAAVSLVLGPVMLMQPTPAQRREAALRKVASEQGLRVHFQPVPKGSDFNGRKSQAITYCLPWREQIDNKSTWVLSRKKFAHDLHFCECWDWVLEPSNKQASQQRALKESLSDIPSSVFALSSGPQGLCCFWAEMGGEDQVRELGEWLKMTAPKISLHASV